MIEITPENLKLVPQIGQYRFYRENKCISKGCNNIPKLYYLDKVNYITAWSLCNKCRRKRENMKTKYIEYSEKDLFTIRLYET